MEKVVCPAGWVNQLNPANQKFSSLRILIPDLSSAVIKIEVCQITFAIEELVPNTFSWRLDIDSRTRKQIESVKSS